MIGVPVRGPGAIGARVSGRSLRTSAPVGAPALPQSDQATTRPVVTESRPVVGETPSLPLHRQK